MLKNLKLTSKLMIGVSLIMIVLLSVNMLFSSSRVNEQAEKGFADKLRQITGMATQTRLWVSAHQDVFKEFNDDGERDIKTVPVVAAWNIAQDYANAQNFEFKTPSLSPRNPKNSADAFEREALLAFESNPKLEEYYTREHVGEH